MPVEIKGIQKTSLIDYSPYVASTIFLGRCNFRCGFCHNKDLVIDAEKMPTIPEEEIIKFLESRKAWIDGVCITGGEPCLHKELPQFIEKLKKTGLLVKLDTNGTNPAMLRELIDGRKIDYVAMDIKNSFEKYEKTVGVKVNLNDIKESIGIIINGDVDYEFRTTILPFFHDESDIRKIGEMLNGAKRVFLQNFKQAETTVDPKFSKMESFSKEKLEKFKGILEECIEEVNIRD